MSTFKYILILLFFTGFFISCNTTKYVPDGEFLLNKVEIKSNSNIVKKEELMDYLKQRPNYKVFGIWNVRLGMYSMSGRDTTKRKNRILKNIGSPPVIYSPDLTERTVRELQRVFYNKGYMDAVVTYDTRFGKKKADVAYNITSGIPYRVGEVSYQIQNPDISKIVLKDSVNSPVKSGILFDGNVLNNERARIVNLLKQQGYYTFSKENIHCFVDSSTETRLINLVMDIRTIPVGTQVTDSVKASKIRQDIYDINDVFILIDNAAQSRGRRREPETNLLDTTLHAGYYIIQNNKHTYRPAFLSNNCFIRPGSRYNENDVTQTSEALRSLQAFKYANIRFQEADSAKLNCYISVNSGKFQSISTSLEGTNSSGDLGVAGSINYRHRNIFHGSEVFGLKFRGAYEALNGSVRIWQNNYTEVGVEASILFPKFQFPFMSKDFKNRLRSTTEYTLAFNRQARPEYERVVLSGSWRYKWALGKGRYQHSVEPLFFDYVHVPYVTDEFLTDMVKYPALLNSFEDHVIAGISHSYYTSNRGFASSLKSLYSVRTTFESAGGVLSAFSTLFGAEKDKNTGYYKIFGAPISQYIKGNIDFSRSYFFNENSSFAYRIGAGVAYPYGNSSILPFERRFYSGGANSVRGWSVRALGPGTYRHSGQTLDYIYQVGDIRMDMNLEWRSHIFWVLQLAAYVDAGNIWTIKNYESQPGGQFKFNKFYEQIAASYGLGLRLDFKYFLLRLDTGMKAYDPSMTDQNRWVMFSPSFSRDFALHFAIGYPF